MKALVTRLAVGAVLALGVSLAIPGAANAQLGRLASPGALSKAHASLEGAAKCVSCHEPGRQVTASKCLTCHTPIAERIARRQGVHRNAGDQCVTCHAEHNGADAELRPFDARHFDHAGETGFALDGKHAPLACARCHKTRSFLTIGSAACATCHTDVHKGSLGTACSTCHATSGTFKDASHRFDHGTTRFPLTGRHQQVACIRCHVNNQFKGITFDSCTSCHKTPHSKPLGTCTTCHTTDTWRTQKFDHSKTAFPLVGRHEAVQCAKCHVQSPMKVKLAFAKCSACHADPHKGRFKETCETCHTVKGFKETRFDHLARTGWALMGRHESLICVACHTRAAAATGAKTKSIDFGGEKRDCVSCHQDPHRGSLGATCTACHGTESFKVTSFTHPGRPEFYVAGHAHVPCASCHLRAPHEPVRTGAAAVAMMTFRGVSTACASCHKDPHLGQLSAACETCHRVDGAKFAPVTFDHARSAFPLSGKHQQVACEQCHKQETGKFPAGEGTARRFKGIGTACATCHTDVHLGQLGTACATCHSTDTFTIRRYTHKNLEGFFVGRHATLECAQCHTREDGAFPGGRGVAVRFKVGRDCASCHRDAHNGQLGKDCAACHTPVLWRDPNRAFHKSGLFPLTGKHVAVPCASCHIKGVLKGTPTQCFDCHWVRRQDDYYQLRLGSRCEECHKTISWTAVVFDHGARTGMALNLPHKLLACDSCHKDRVFEGRRPECIACHEQQFRQTKNPDHVAAGFPVTCDLCHKPSAPTFGGATFLHASYQLRGAHATADCQSCHKTGVYAGTPRDCYSCHRSDFQRTSNPNHAAAGFPTTCETCHREGGPEWKTSGAGFNHATFFALNGAHATTSCASCHKNGQYAGTPKDCYSCHQTDYQQSKNPNHVTAGFPLQCEQCHRPGGPGWSQNGFKHTASFPLTGTHAATGCIQCHANGVYQGTPKACVACHQTDYQKAANPNHVLAGFPTSCEQCHKSGGPGWTGANFNHAQFFALNGGHATTSCASCHKNGVYVGTPKDCYSCHKADYQQTSNPNHPAAGFPTTCDQCHRSGGPGWSGANFNHAQFFALSGMHATASCASCHKNGVYVGTPKDCYSCHKTDYQQTSNPNHPAAGFPTTCDQCHKSGGPGWTGASFNHAQFFALVGVHATQPCAACHKNSVYKGTPTTCVGCHLAKYTATSNPNHAAAGFPTTCETCHKATDTSWSQGRFNHTFFPITSGRHAGLACSVCHTTASNFALFSCTTACHPKAETDSHHQGRAGYRYDSAACYSCHPNGRAD